jgi:hypothetical protein
MSFTFSDDIVKGFGVWVYDDSAGWVASFSMTVEDLLGNTWTSDILDASPGSGAHTVEGFIGVTLTDGIKSVKINQLPGNPPGVSLAFEIDHMQIASIPEPATMFLFGTGLVVLAGTGIRRKKRQELKAYASWGGRWGQGDDGIRSIPCSTYLRYALPASDPPNPPCQAPQTDS